MNREVYIHVGFHRTGTTFLQKEILPKYEGRASVITPHNDSSNITDLLMNRWPHPGNIPKTSELDGLVGGEIKDKLIISREGISGPSYFHNDLYSAKRIAHYFPGAKIIVTIRAQSSILLSIYSHNYIKKGMMDYKSFVMRMYLGGKVDYYNFIGPYLEIFKEENIIVIPIELLKEDVDSYCKEWSKLLGLPKVNIGASDQNNMNKRKDDNNVIDMINKNRREIGVTDRYDKSQFQSDKEEVDSWLQEAYGESNRLLCQRLQIDLTSYGYQV